jgi:glycosyltransferase involved in cell wall biosynthesis
MAGTGAETTQMSDERPTFSVIVPVFNVPEAYLRECFGSVQGLPGVEVIAVDDGSNAECAAFLDEYASKNPSVRVVHKPNGGPSSARNAGIKEAKNEYLVFLDADDFMEPHWEADMRLTISKFSFPDVLLVKKNRLTSDNAKTEIDNGYSPRKVASHEGSAFLRYMTSRKRVMPGVSDIAPKRDFALKEDLFFDERLPAAEDAEWCQRLYRKARTYAMCEKPLYDYRMVSGSRSHTYDEKAYLAMDAWMSEQKADVDALSDKKLRRYTYSLWCEFYFWLIIRSAWFYRNDRQLFDETYGYIQKYKWLIPYGRTRRFRVFKACRYLFGLKGAIRLLGPVADRKL